MKKKLLIVIGIIVALILIILISAKIWYEGQIKPISSQSNEIIIKIESGTTSSNIIQILKESNLIKSELATKIYIKLNNVKNLQAGKYKLNQNMNLEEILSQISNGQVQDETLKITFLEGKNMGWYAKKIAEETTNKEEDVYNLLKDEDYIKSLIKEYWFLDNTILDDEIYYPLEGYLYPNTYTLKNNEVTVKEIFKILLDETEKNLDNYKAKIKLSKYSVHQILTLASIVELEGTSDENRNQISSVIYNRLAKNMSIGSDVTTYYAIKIDMGERDLYATEINTYNAYNTRGPNMTGKLPIGPISSISLESIEAVLEPANTNYLYFVADMNKKIYFFDTYEEHQEKIQELKKSGLWYQY